MPYSPGQGNDDKVHDSMDYFIGKEVVITEKMDGENTSIYPDGYVHARSTESISHASQSWVRSFGATYGPMLYDLYGDSARLVGENLYALHSIHYTNLRSYFYLFSVWDDMECLSWKEVEKVSEALGIPTVPVLYKGLYDELVVKSLAQTMRSDQEGFVVRLAGDIFGKEIWMQSSAKYVRANHISSTNHWKHQSIVKNKLA